LNLGSSAPRWSCQPHTAGRPLPSVELPVRVVAGLGPLYVRTGVTLGLDLPTKNSKLLHEESPDIYDEPEAETRLQLNIGLGVRL
jgi:hypothetical protein